MQGNQTAPGNRNMGRRASARNGGHNMAACARVQKSDHVLVEIGDDGKKTERDNSDDDSVASGAIPIDDDATNIMRKKRGVLFDPMRARCWIIAQHVHA